MTIKDPDATLDYSVDWTAWLAEGDAAAQTQWDVPDGLTVVRVEQFGAVSTVWVSGGDEGATYRLTCRITTTAGRVDERSRSLRIQNR
jgi:hypothetical protein